MVSEPSGEDRAIEKIMTVFDGPSVDALTRRVLVLYNLAKDCKKGEIVELGTYHGYGAFALAYGIREPFTPAHDYIFTVDDYTEKHGWAGEPYGQADFSIFMDKRRKLRLQADVVWIGKDAVEAAEFFDDGEVGLLYIDTGVIEELPKIFNAWKDKICDGGIVAFRDTLTRSLGCDKIAANAVLDGKFAIVDSPDQYFILLRRVA